MLKRLTVFLLIAVLAHAEAQDIWIQRDSVNGPPRGACAGFSVAGEAFVIGGINMEEYKRKMYSYDLDQDDWDDELALGGIAGDGLE